MIVRSSTARSSIPSLLTPFTNASSTSISSTQCRRHLHQSMRAAPIPRPTPFVPDTQTFLTLIGRNLSQHAAKITSWNALFSLTSPQLKELGVEPPRARRYLLRWREKFRQGQFGIGGDIKHVKDGIAHLKVFEQPLGDAPSPAALANRRRIVVNVPADAAAEDVTTSSSTTTTTTAESAMVPVRGFKVLGTRTIAGPHVEGLKGGQGARLQIKEGLWEHRRGHKVDGGERRQAEVRFKRRAEARRAAR